MHVRTDSHSTPTNISSGVGFLQEKANYIQIHFITTIMHQYIPGKKDFQLVTECCTAYQQAHHMALTISDLTDTACMVLYMYGLLFCCSLMRVGVAEN